jgi:hypothetical protein
MKKTLVVTAALVASLNLSGCVIALAGGNYHPDHGDLVSNDGNVRYVGWCHLHARNAHCQDSQAVDTAALNNPIVVASDRGDDGAQR